MKTTIKTTHCDLTPDISTYLDERIATIARLVDPIDDAATCAVELARETAHQHGRIWRAEMNLMVKGEVIRVEATEESLQAAIDEVKDEMTQRVRKIKGKRESLFRKGTAAIKNAFRS